MLVPPDKIVASRTLAGASRDFLLRLKSCAVCPPLPGQVPRPLPVLNGNAPRLRREDAQQFRYLYPDLAELTIRASDGLGWCLRRLPGMTSLGLGSAFWHREPHEDDWMQAVRVSGGAWPDPPFRQGHARPDRAAPIRSCRCPQFRSPWGWQYRTGGPRPHRRAFRLAAVKVI